MKRKLLLCFLLFSIIFNIINLYSMSINEKTIDKADRQFLSSLNNLDSSFKTLNDDKIDMSRKMRNCSSRIGSVIALCKLTSFQDNNKGLYGVFSELNLAIIDLSENKILANTTKISDYLIKIYYNPTDSNITDEFNQFIFELKTSN